MSSETSASPEARRARIALRVGSASAAKTELKRSTSLSIAIQLYCHLAMYKSIDFPASPAADKVLTELSANRKLSRNASAVSDAPPPTPEIYLPLIMGRVRYSCLKEAAAEEAPMQIQWGCGDEKGLGNECWSESERGPDWFDCSLRAKARSQELGMGQPGRTTPAGDGKHRGGEIVIRVSCSGSGEKGWRTELELGSGKSVDDHHAAATFGTDRKS